MIHDVFHIPQVVLPHLLLRPGARLDEHERARDVARDGHHAVKRQPAGVRVEDVPQRAARHVLHQQIAEPRPLVARRAVDLDEVRMLHPLREVGLVADALEEFGVGTGDGRIEHLERAPQAFRVFGEKNLARAARTEPFYDAEIPEYASGNQQLSPVRPHVSPSVRSSSAVGTKQRRGSNPFR